MVCVCVCLYIYVCISPKIILFLGVVLSIVQEWCLNILASLGFDLGAGGVDYHFIFALIFYFVTFKSLVLFLKYITLALVCWFADNFDLDRSDHNSFCFYALQVNAILDNIDLLFCPVFWDLCNM